MTANTEQALRAIIAMDPTIGRDAADAAIAALKDPSPDGGRTRRVLSPADAAKLLNVSTRTLRNWTKSGRIRAVSSSGDTPRAVGYDSDGIAALIANG